VILAEYLRENGGAHPHSQGRARASSGRRWAGVLGRVTTEQSVLHGRTLPAADQLTSGRRAGEHLSANVPAAAIVLLAGDMDAAETAPPPSAPVTRRAVLGGAAVAAGALAMGVGPGVAAAGTTRAASAPAGLDVHVLVVDGCRPDEVAAGRMPTVSSLAALGSSYTSARAVDVAETIPNHVAMMTGVLPARSGVPANSVYDRGEGVVRDLDRPSDLLVPTLLERLPAERGVRTASILSKNYLYGVFGTRASYRWKPEPLLPLTAHAPDQSTMNALLSALAVQQPRMTFTNLGDVDRVGHADLSGTSLRLARTAALTATDAQLARFVQALRSSGAWQRSVVVVLADHSMDWSLPTALIGLAGVLDRDPQLTGNVKVAQNGGADLLYWTGSATRRSAAVARMRSLASATPGVLSVQPPSELGLGAQAGDLVAFCKPGWRFADPTPLSNPIPGNHGHPTTRPIPFVISGGHPRVRRGLTHSLPVSTMDVAPTVAWLLGLRAPGGGWDGAARTEAFLGAGRDASAQEGEHVGD